MALSLKKVDAKGKKRRPHAFRDRRGGAGVFRCPVKPGMTKGKAGQGENLGGATGKRPIKYWRSDLFFVFLLDKYES